ncbi:MAG TPA: penicillin acylase family protein [Marinospirillum sp.]|uniref:penicillin acylase family protein n=1 Tax=Marinospirillum sp. TaxID=2183934 RepID=UPI002B4A67AA|nr:penicillin acylase family protein [Marinospirillum sp.]HKM16104.1 penicillin acylase family protein [Marinospirillum sp.]
MKRFFSFALLLIAIALGGYWFIQQKLPQRSGEIKLEQLSEAVSVHYDERGVPHIQAATELDAYRALGYVHAQDRLFQMEMVRRLAQGQLSEVLGEKTVKIDRLFRTLRLHQHAKSYLKTLDPNSPAMQSLNAYLDGINQYQATRAKPLEFDLLGISPRPFTAEDTISVAGYLAYSFAAAFRTEPVLTYIRDELGEDYLRIFDLSTPSQGDATYPEPSSTNATSTLSSSKLTANDWQGLNALAEVSQAALFEHSLPQFEGSNAWVMAGSKTQSGKPLLAGDPHIGFSVPAVWYEAHLQTPSFELYGHFQALNPFALLGHNQAFGWSLTMFQNDDLDLIALPPNWDNLTRHTELIAIKGQAAEELTLYSSDFGPIINAALGEKTPDTPIALWWAFLETKNPILDAFYDFNRANTLNKARAAASKIHAPGLNMVWANAEGDIAWWAAGKMPIRDASTQPAFILDSQTDQAKKYGFYPFSDNPQEENPERGYIVSANYLPASPNQVPLPGYYNLADRGEQLIKELSQPNIKWNTQNSQAVQLGEQSGYAPRLLKPLLGDLYASASSKEETLLINQLAKWQGSFPTNSYLPTVFTEFTYQLLTATFLDELGEATFNNLLNTRIIDSALPLLVANPTSPWWNNQQTGTNQTRQIVVGQAWQATLKHLNKVLGPKLDDWQWGKAHTLTHNHPLGAQKPLDKLFNVGNFAAPGGHELPNNLSSGYSSAPWAVEYGPSTRRLIDFAAPEQALGINPVGQSGVKFDKHYSDQAKAYSEGRYYPQHLAEKDIEQNTQSRLTLVP